MSHKTQRNAEEGQALIEFALTVPILLMFVFGIIDVARLVFAYAQTIDAARQGIRYGIVEGLESNSYQFFDCEGIRNAATDLPGLVTDVEVNVSYETPDGTKITDCRDDLTLWDVNDGDVLAVRVKGSIMPITPVLMMFTDSISFNYTSRRTIVGEGAAFTDEWPEPPERAENFRAAVNCTLSEDNVTFTWSPLSPVPDRAEIRNSLTGEVVVELNNTEPGLIDNAYCDNCATISPDDGYGMYYMVSYTGTPPNEMVSAPSDDAIVRCGINELTERSGGIWISGQVWWDKNWDKTDSGQSEKGISQVSIYLTDAGPDGTLHTSDDQTYMSTTDKDGKYYFTGLEVPYGLSGQEYWIEVVQTSPSLGDKVLTTNNSPQQIHLGKCEVRGNIDFGFDAP